jgi:hypothetical protein
MSDSQQQLQCQPNKEKRESIRVEIQLINGNPDRDDKGNREQSNQETSKSDALDSIKRRDRNHGNFKMMENVGVPQSVRCNATFGLQMSRDN